MKGILGLKDGLAKTFYTRTLLHNLSAGMNLVVLALDKLTNHHCNNPPSSGYGTLNASSYP